MIIVREGRSDPGAGAAGPPGVPAARRSLPPGDPIPPGAVWLDLIAPTAEEEILVEARFGLDVPTREDVRDIEPSELLYMDNGARVMTARLLCDFDTDAPRLAPVTFILKGEALATVRYDEPKSFQTFIHRADRPGGCGAAADEVLAGLIDTIIGRTAEVLQGVGERVDALSAAVFRSARARRAAGRGYQETLGALGLEDDRISKVRESLVSIERMLLFLTANLARDGGEAALRAEARTTLRDIQSLEEHATFLSSKIQFVLDATLGLVAIAQNDSFKVFSVVSVALMPPTLIAGVYGMNFKHMPELEWLSGYPWALGLMLLAGLVPLAVFRWRGLL